MDDSTLKLLLLCACLTCVSFSSSLSLILAYTQGWLDELIFGKKSVKGPSGGTSGGTSGSSNSKPTPSGSGSQWKVVDYTMGSFYKLTKVTPEGVVLGTTLEPTNTDLAGNPRHGTLTQCQGMCAGDSQCKGFSWKKASPITSIDECWLKKDVTTEAYKVAKDPTWHTYIR